MTTLCKRCLEHHDGPCLPIWETHIAIQCSVCGNTTNLSADAGFAMHDINCGQCGELGFEQIEWTEAHKAKYRKGA